MASGVQREGMSQDCGLDSRCWAAAEGGEALPPEFSVGSEVDGAVGASTLRDTRRTRKGSFSTRPHQGAGLPHREAETVRITSVMSAEKTMQGTEWGSFQKQLFGVVTVLWTWNSQYPECLDTGRN